MATVDILMATYNGERFVREQIESIQAQSFEDWRLLVSDDCSTDETLCIVREIAKEDPRVRIVSQGVRYGSAKANFMHLLSLAEAPYAMLSDQDDIWFSDKIELTLEQMGRLESRYGAEMPLLVFADMMVVNSELVVVSESLEKMQHLKSQRVDFPSVLAQAFGAGCTFLMNKKLTDIAFCCKDVNKIIMHDWWISIAAAAFGHIGCVRRAVSFYRQHEENSVGAKQFNILAWALKMDVMYNRQRRIAEQAKCFVCTFERDLSYEKLAIARKCAETCGEDRFENLRNLILSGAWKVGVRKLGQIVAVLRGGGNHRGGIV